MDTITLATLGAIVWKVVDFIKNLRAGQMDPVVTQLVLWVAGVAVALLAANANAASDIKVWGMTLGQLDGPSLILLGISLSSFAGVGYDFKKAIDNNGNANQPTLLGPLGG